MVVAMHRDMTNQDDLTFGSPLHLIVYIPQIHVVDTHTLGLTLKAQPYTKLTCCQPSLILGWSSPDVWEAVHVHAGSSDLVCLTVSSLDVVSSDNCMINARNAVAL